MQNEQCPKCGVDPGQYHESGCDVEQCPYCGGQLISCCCDDVPPLDDRMPWTGLWPGVDECREFGWYATPGPRGWVPCGQDEPGLVMEDLNRLHAQARWDRRNKRFVMRKLGMSQFWRLIENAKEASGGDCGRQVECLSGNLSELTVEEIVGFDENLYELRHLLNRDDLWAVAADIHDGRCSDDGFDYFRGWLIAQGVEMCMRGLLDPQSLIGEVTPVAWCEGILYVAKEAYQLKTGLDMEEVWENWPPVCRTAARLVAASGQAELSRYL